MKNILRVGQIMRHKVLQFCTNFGNFETNYPFTFQQDVFEKLTDISFVYFMHSIIILQCLKKSLKRMTKYKVAQFLDKLT